MHRYRRWRKDGVGAGVEQGVRIRVGSLSRIWVYVTSDVRSGELIMDGLDDNRKAELDKGEVCGTRLFRKKGRAKMARDSNRFPERRGP